MTLRPALEQLHASTLGLAQELAETGERHAGDHDVFHMGRLLSARCAGLGSMLEPFLTGDARADGQGSFSSAERRSAREVTEAAERSGPTLLRDLRQVEIDAHACVTDWMIVHQGAMATRDQKLLNLCELGMDEMRRVERWLTTRIKESAPQILVSSPDARIEHMF